MNGLLVVPPICGNKKNIGDYIQSVAQEQYWNYIDCYVEREKLASFYSKEKTNLIMNGWFMWNAEQFPPSDSINPFFISFHLSPSVSSRLLTPASIAYFKKYEPIGCRDIDTQKILESHGIKCYFSGCLTLTLNLKYSNNLPSGKIIIADPYFEIGGSKNFSQAKRLGILLKESLLYPKTISKIKALYCKNREYVQGVRGFIRKWIEAASLHYTYSSFLADDVLLNATYVSHIVDQTGMDEDGKMELAKQYIKMYGSAKMVITSRIHAALPCLSLNTPVIFCTTEKLANNGLEGSAGGRFAGLIDLLNSISMDGRDITCSDSLKGVLQKGKLTMSTIFFNPNNHRVMAKNLTEKTFAFVHKCEMGGVKPNSSFTACRMAA